MSGEERTRAQAVLADYLALARSALDELVGVLARDGATAEREGFRERIGAQLDATRAALAPLAERAPLRRVEHPRARGAQADLARALDQAGVAGRAVTALLAAETVATELAEPTLARELHRMRREQEAYVRYLERLVGKLTRAAVRDEVGRDTVRALHAELARSAASERRGHRSGPRASVKTTERAVASRRTKPPSARPSTPSVQVTKRSSPGAGARPKRVTATPPRRTSRAGARRRPKATGA